MKLLTLNCHGWQEENQLKKIKHLAVVIKEKQYDVIALQEVMQLIDEKNNEKVKPDNYAVVLLEELKKLGVKDYHFVWDVSHIGFDVYEEGSAILTRLEIKGTNSFVVSKNTDISNYHTRRIIGLDLLYQERPLTVYSCHLGWYHSKEDPFVGQIDQLMTHLSLNHLNILMGDFNNDANEREEGYDYLINKGFIDTYTVAKIKDNGVTVSGKIDGWGNNKKDLRLDYILMNQSVNVKSSAVIFNGENKEVVSDHFGVEVELELK